MPEEKVSTKWVSSCTLADYPHNCPQDRTGHFAPPLAADAGPRPEHTSDCCLDLDHKGDCRRWMRLLENSYLKGIHIQDDGCPKAGCRPASRCEIEAYLGHATAPDWAMRVARKIVPSVHENYAFDDTLPEREAVYAHVATLIREAGSERERALRTAQRYIKALQRVLDEDFTPVELRTEVSAAWNEWASASRLLGGESK